MSQLENNASASLEFMNSDHSNNLRSEESSFYKKSTFRNLLTDSNASQLAPFKSCFTEEYLKAAQKLKTNDNAPISVYDGLQTTINICRSK